MLFWCKDFGTAVGGNRDLSTCVRERYMALKLLKINRVASFQKASLSGKICYSAYLASSSNVAPRRDRNVAPTEMCVFAIESRQMNQFMKSN